MAKLGKSGKGETPAPSQDAMSLFGIAGNNQPRDPHEMEKAHQATADDIHKAYQKTKRKYRNALKELAK